MKRTSGKEIEHLPSAFKSEVVGYIIYLSVCSTRDQAEGLHCGGVLETATSIDTHQWEQASPRPAY